MILGVGLLLQANAHWLDQPERRTLTVEGVHGRDDRYPGFLGTDATAGLMVDVRLWRVLGVEMDLFYQDDHGTGTLVVRDCGSLCLLPAVELPIRETTYTLTIGQRALHLPVLLKLAIPRQWSDARRKPDDRETKPRDDRRQLVRSSVTFAFGPEWVFPESAELKVEGGPLDEPAAAKADDYMMWTAALGWERRLSRRTDLRLLFSLRGSYNPGPKDWIAHRASYDVQRGELIALSYFSEWRYQVAGTAGLGWFF